MRKKLRFTFHNDGYEFESMLALFVRIIAWAFFVVLMTAFVLVLLYKRESYQFLFASFFVSGVAFIFTRLRISYRLDRVFFSRTAKPKVLFSWLDRKINYHDDGFKYILLTRSNPTGYSNSMGIPEFYSDLKKIKDTMVFMSSDDVISMNECFSSNEPKEAYEFALKLKELTGFEIVFDPLWDSVYRKDIDEAKAKQDFQ